jgi:uncharacterized protein YraI
MCVSFLCRVIPLLGILMAFAPVTFAQSGGTYRVVDVARNDVLNVRSGPSDSFSIVGIIPPDGTGVSIVTGCERAWCDVSYQGVRGWVNVRFLTLENGPSAPSKPAVVPSMPPVGRWLYRVVGIANNDVLNIRNGPSAGDRIVGMIPPNARDVSVEENTGTWWRVNYNRVSGWANRIYLRPDRFCKGDSCGDP